jgi:hypothetical protein
MLTFCSHSIWDDVEDRMLARLKDRYPFVRTQAVIALSPLQDSQSKNDLIVQEFLQLLRNDSNK